MPQELGNIPLNTQLLNKAEVSGVIVDTLDKVEDIVAEAVSTAWKAGGSQPASAFSNNALLIEANEGKVYNLSDALTITDQNKQYFTENATGTYPAGTNVAVIQTVPPTYTAASGTAVANVTYYSKMGPYYTEVAVAVGDPVDGLWVRSTDATYKYDVLAGTDSANVKQINVNDNSPNHRYTPVNGVVTLPFASGTSSGSSNGKDGFISAADIGKLNDIESGANRGIAALVADGATTVSPDHDNGSVVTISGYNGISTVSGHDNNSTLIISAETATTSSPGVVTLQSVPSYEWSVYTTGVATVSGVVSYVNDYGNDLGRFDALTVKYADPDHPGQVASGSLSTSGGNTLEVTLGENMTASDFYDGNDDSDRRVTIDAVVPVKKVKVYGSASSLSPDQSGRVTIPSGTTSARGVVKLYTSADGSNTDGAVTQKAVSGAIAGIRNFSNISTNGGTQLSPGSLTDTLYVSGRNGVVVSGRLVPVTSGTQKHLYIKGDEATSSAPGVMKLYTNADGSNTDGAVTQKAVSGAIAGLRNFSSVTVYHDPTDGTYSSGALTPASNSSRLSVTFDRPLTISSLSNDSVVVGVISATSSDPGVMKLYTGATGSNTDGAVTQKAVSGAIAGLRNYSSITTKYQEMNPGGTALEWKSGTTTPSTNSTALTVCGVQSTRVYFAGSSLKIGVARPDPAAGWPGVVTLNDAVGSSSGANKGIAASPLMVTNSTVTRVKKSITLSGLRQVSNDTQTPIPASINSTDMPNTLYGLIKALKFAANHAS